MRTAADKLHSDVAPALLHTIIDAAARRRYKQLSLETGSMVAFKPAHALYAKFGFVFCVLCFMFCVLCFVFCETFKVYVDDSNSVFMTQVLML